MAMLEKLGVEPISDECAAAVDRIVDYAFWQLMLNDDLEACERDISLLCSAINLRWAQVKSSARRDPTW
jgi:hypothetical protein